MHTYIHRVRTHSHASHTRNRMQTQCASACVQYEQHWFAVVGLRFVLHVAQCIIHANYRVCDGTLYCDDDNGFGSVQRRMHRVSPFVRQQRAERRREGGGMRPFSTIPKMKYDPQIVNISKTFDLLLIMCTEANNFYICYSFCVSSTSPLRFRWYVISRSSHASLSPSLPRSSQFVFGWGYTVAAASASKNRFTQDKLRSETLATCDIRALPLTMVSPWNSFRFHHHSVVVIWKTLYFFSCFIAYLNLVFIFFFYSRNAIVVGSATGYRA